MIPIPTLTTQRLILRPYRIEDFEAVAAMWTEPGVVRFIGGAPVSREVAWGRFLRQIGLWHYLGFGYFAVEDRETGALLGEVGFQDMRRDIVPSIEGTMEAGWVLAGAAQGKGLAEEAMRAALDWAERCHQDRRITCFIQTEHAASLHVARKLGFVFMDNGIYNGKAVIILERPRPPVAPAG